MPDSDPASSAIIKERRSRIRCWMTSFLNYRHSAFHVEKQVMTCNAFGIIFNNKISYFRAMKIKPVSMRLYSFYIIILLLLFPACGQSDLGPAEVLENYSAQIEEWKQNRVESLKAPTGWLRLSGMFILDEGENTFGSGTDRDIRFPEGTIPENAGTFLYEDGRVMMRVANDVEISHDGEPVDEMVLYDGDETPRAEYRSLEWFVIIRDDITAIRLYNKENEKADNFDGFPAYPVDPEWNRKARFIPNPEETTISIVNVLGQQVDARSPGVLEFTINGETFTLDALEGGERLFIILGDETNRTETYQAGRYMYIDYPEEGREVTEIDFNKAYNPPCAFNVFTTCQLPPPQNRLETAITAGEKRPVEWEGL